MRLINMVNDQVRELLQTAHALSSQLAVEITTGAKERATYYLVDQTGRSGDVRGFASHLNERERLNASLLLRALAHGDMAFFEHGVSELAAPAIRNGSRSGCCSGISPSRLRR